MTEEYAAALDKIRTETSIFRLSQIAYRNRLCGDAEFLEAKRVYEAAEREFDRAYDIKCQLQPVETMEEALEADGEKLRQLTGEDHGPW